MKIFQELKRRNVFKVGIVYAVTTWILLQLTDVVADILELPGWTPKLILLILVVGFVPALIIAWAFELTPEGIKLEKDVQREQSATRKTGRKLDYVIIVLLGLSLGYFIWESRFEQEAAEIRATPNEVAGTETVAEPEPPSFDISEPVPEVDENSIAVLPFANRSADDTDIYFTDGIHDDLLTHLSRIDAFRVISRTSVMEYRDTEKNIKDIARELNVANVMEGAVQRAGDRVRINVQLIDADSDEHLWAEIYDRELTTENLFDIQSEIAQNIADALRATLTEGEKALVANAPTDNLEAYDLYLQARQFAIGETQIGYQTALELFKEALILDPDFALAWIGLGKAHITNYWLYGGDPANRDEAREAIDRARALDTDVPELYMAEGFYWYWGHLDYERALYNLDKAIELMPRNEEARMWKGWTSRRHGLWDQALESMEYALRLNPRVHFNWIELALTYMYLHRFEEAGEAVEKARDLDINHFWTKDVQGRLAMLTGDLAGAVRYTTGAQHGDEAGFFITFLDSRVLARRFDDALEAARQMSAEFEIQRQAIELREVLAALVLFHAGRHEEAREAARAAMFRLKGLRDQLGEDYRILHAESRLSPILGEPKNETVKRIEKARSADPVDDVELFRREQQRAQAFAMAGMTSEVIDILDEFLVRPSELTVHTVDADPAFDGIRNDPKFIAMMERHR